MLLPLSAGVIQSRCCMSWYMEALWSGCVIRYDHYSTLTNSVCYVRADQFGLQFYRLGCTVLSVLVSDDVSIKYMIQGQLFDTISSISIQYLPPTMTELSIVWPI